MIIPITAWRFPSVVLGIFKTSQFTYMYLPTEDTCNEKEMQEDPRSVCQTRVE
jgi:hypothetical protein